MLGENYRGLGFLTVEKFLEAACKSEREHLLKLFLPFATTVRDVKYGHGTLRNALIQKNWADAAWLYNGPGYRKYDYDNQLKAAYEKIKAGALRV